MAPVTQRTAHLKDHAGQISLPGGRLEPGEDRWPQPCARRTRRSARRRQTGVPGELRPYLTGTGFRIHPVVGWVDLPERFTTDPFEVEELFELPLGFVMDPANHRQDSYERNGRQASVLRAALCRPLHLGGHGRILVTSPGSCARGHDRHAGPGTLAAGT